MKCKVIGKRGGVSMDDVTCVTCVAWPGCKEASTINLNWGCAAWVDFENGARIAPGAAADLPVEVAEATMEPDPLEPGDITSDGVLHRGIPKKDEGHE